MKRILWLCVVGLSIFAGCSPKNVDQKTMAATDKPKPAANSADTDPRIKKIKDRIAQQSSDCKDAVDKVKGKKLTINGVKSAVSPGEIADRFAKQSPNIGIGWEAFKNPDNIYDVWYHFRNSKGEVMFAKWSYNAKTDEVKPADAMGFQFSYASQ